MASRRLLTSVADGVARAFVSRNNDLGGWWVPALLMDVGARLDPAYRLDLMTGVTVPTNSPTVANLGPAWARYFAWTLGRHGVRPGWVKEATLVVRFDYDGVGPFIRFGRTHRPFVCTVRISDDRGRAHERSAIDASTPLAEFDWSSPPAERPSRSAEPYDPGRVEWRIRRSPQSQVDQIGLQ